MAGISRFRSRAEFYSNVQLGTIWTWDAYHGGFWTTPNSVWYKPIPNYVPKWLEECSDELHPGPPYKTGGPFFLRRLSVPFHQIGSGVWIKPGTWKYEGGFYVNPMRLVSTYDSLKPEAAGYGAKGWHMFRPVKPVNSLGQFIAELRDVKSQFTGLKRGLRTLKDLGHHYLNIQFGWKPFLSDLQSFLCNGQKIARRMSYIRRNNGKWIKRGGTISNTDSRSSLTDMDVIIPHLPYQFYPPTGATKAKRWITNETHIWFEARMKYYIPSLSSDDGRNFWTSPLLRKMWGLELSPSLVWELLPWSWLFDWFSDIGDFYSNISDQAYDNLVAKYAYVMETKETIYHFDQIQPWRAEVIGAPLHVQDARFQVVMKERVEGSPYGFHLSADWSDLSASQLAILASLGVTHGRK